MDTLRKDLTKEILACLEEHANWWIQAAVNCEELAAGHGMEKLSEAQKLANWQLLAAVYRERAELSARSVEAFRKEAGAEATARGGSASS